MQRIKTTKATKFAAIGLALVLSFALTACGSGQAKDNLPSNGKGQVKNIDPGADNNQDVTEESTGEIDGSGSVESQALAKDLCGRVGENVIEYSKISAENQGSEVFVDRIIAFKLIEDNRKTVKTPTGDTRNTVIKCHVTAHLSNGYSAEMDIYELLASDGETRVRWDNITNTVRDK